MGNVYRISVLLIFNFVGIHGSASIQLQEQSSNDLKSYIVEENFKFTNFNKKNDQILRMPDNDVRPDYINRWYVFKNLVSDVVCSKKNIYFKTEIPTVHIVHFWYEFNKYYPTANNQPLFTKLYFENVWFWDTIDWIAQTDCNFKVFDSKDPKVHLLSCQSSVDKFVTDFRDTGFAIRMENTQVGANDDPREDFISKQVDTFSGDLVQPFNDFF